MKKVTYEAVLSALTEVVAAEVPEYSYEPKEGEEGTRCFYVWEGQPDCGVGRALHKLGVPLEALSEHEGVGAQSLLDHLELDEVIATDEQSKYMLRAFQRRQDVGVTWREALKTATTWYEDHSE